MKLQTTILIFTLLISTLNAQQKLLRGKVLHKSHKTPVEFANVYVKNSSIGTITDVNGNFTLRIPLNTPEFYVSAVGYITKEIKVANQTESLTIMLEEDILQIEEVVVSLGKNPALAMHDSIIKYKKRNDPSNITTYKAKIYEKETYLFTGLDTGFTENVFFRKHKNAFMKMEQDSQFCFPILFSEKIYNKYTQTNPYKTRIEILAEKKDGVNFIKGNDLAEFVGTIDVNFYQNHLFVLDKDFLSPLSSTGPIVYNYFLTDTSKSNDTTFYKIKFKPKVSRDLLLTGFFWYNSKTHAVTEIEAKIDPRANLNFIQDFRIKKSHQLIDGSYFWKNEYFIFDFVFLKKQDTTIERTTIRLVKTTNYSNVSTDTIKEVAFEQQNTNFEIIKEEEATAKDSIFWQNNRSSQLDSSDLLAEVALQNVNKIGLVKVTDRMADMLLSGWIKAGAIEIGPWESLVKKNILEGFRFAFGARLAPHIAKRTLISGYTAYGLTDNKWKFGGTIGYSFTKSKFHTIHAKFEDNTISTGNYKNYVSYIRENLFVRDEQSLLEALLSHKENDRVYRLIEAEVMHIKEWKPGISTRLFYSYYEHYSNKYFPFTHNNQLLPTLINNEITIHARLTKNENVSNGYFKRRYYLTKYPRVHLISTFGKYRIGSITDKYLSLRTVVEHYYPIGFGKLGYIVEAGHIFGTVPYLLLEIPRGNVSYSYNRFSYNLLNPLEYANDTYVNLYLEYQTNGFLFNRIPLLKYLNLRESFTAKLMYGSTNPEHQQIIDFPERTTALNGFYSEVGFGVTNLFQFIRIHNTWRLTDSKSTKTLRYIFQIGVHVEF
ncbi:MAG: carboxypeptidase-like regulatory domain-containing protein [Bacteroidales bacterium]|nr:carboxypeptidase-like regulatory domain-containing protein [Bacteroidales bacterium]